jgi:hypothetical protein
MAEKMDLFSQAVILFVRIRLTTLGGQDPGRCLLPKKGSIPDSRITPAERSV